MLLDLEFLFGSSGESNLVLAPEAKALNITALSILGDYLGWRSLEQRRADARLCLFYKIVYGVVAIYTTPRSYSEKHKGLQIYFNDFKTGVCISELLQILLFSSGYCPVECPV